MNETWKFRTSESFGGQTNCGQCSTVILSADKPILESLFSTMFNKVEEQEYRVTRFVGLVSQNSKQWTDKLRSSQGYTSILKVTKLIHYSNRGRCLREILLHSCQIIKKISHNKTSQFTLSFENTEPGCWNWNWWSGVYKPSS